MNSLFVESDRKAVLDRIARLAPDTPRRWGKMDAAQMLGHLAASIEMATSAEPGKQGFPGKLFGRFVRGKALGPEPFGKNLPTAPHLVVADARDLARERERLTAVVERFVANGPAEAGRHLHVFFGRLSGEEWGVLTWKHADHHLRQFGL